MDVAVAVLATLSLILLVVAVVLAVRLRRERSARADEVSALDARLAEERESRRLADERGATVLAERDDLASTLEDLRGELAEVADMLADLSEDHASTVEQRDALAADRDVLTAELDALAADRDRLVEDNDALVEEIVPLRERAAELEERTDRFREEHRAGLDATALWELEVSRATRTWRHSVAVSPDQPSPFTDVDDPLRVAVEVEVATLREDVGVDMTLAWTARVDEPARRLLVLRLVQELLAVASREEEAVVLTGTRGDDGSVHLHLTVPEEQAPIGAITLAGVEHLVTLDISDGVKVIVHP